MKKIPVLYENDEILIVNKKSGLAVQGGEKVSNSLDTLLSQQIGKKVFLVHRLDKDTAGILVVAKTPAAASKWTKIISGDQVKKEYRALCIGSLGKKKRGTITECIEQHGKIKAAVTHYQVMSGAEVPLLAEKTVHLSLLSLVLETGRMHQIRIHLAKQGCPIAGDDRHGNFKLNKILRKELGIKRLMLASVSLTIPVEGRTKVFSIPLPSCMRTIVDTFFPV